MIMLSSTDSYVISGSFKILPDFWAEQTSHPEGGKKNSVVILIIMKP